MKTAATLFVVCVGALLSLGLVILYSAGMNHGGARYLLMQLVWCGIGLVACAIAAWMDYRWFKNLAWLLLAAAVVILSLVLIPGIGVQIKGARRWFDLGFAKFQPSEAAKLALIIALAHYADRNQHLMATFKRGLLVPGFFISVVLALIFVEPDRGTTVLLAATTGVMLLIAGVRWMYLLPPVGAAACALAYSLWHDPVRLGRILSWLHPEAHREGVGFQAWQARLALGTGGWTGLGLGNGRQKLGFIPEHETDFILSVIGEELGAIATLGIVVLFIVLVICGVYIAWNSRDSFGMLLGSGVVFLIGFQALINIGVVTGVFPNKGLPLPFISYGGSNLLLMLTCVGVIMSIARHVRDPVAVEAERYSSKNVFAPQIP
ncbi:MAG: putative lipid II flippase FtsW [Verrucomicrobia bacterium]|nr:putative lipid II flippase FtsW [Verrucomicrobiota bacterium]